MSAAVREWLPLDVGHRAALKTTLEGAVAAWSRRWFGDRRVRTPTCRPCITAQGEGDNWVRPAAQVAVGFAPRAARRLSGWALDNRLDGLTLSDVDLEILDQVEGAILKDLAASVEAVLGVQAQLGAEPSEIVAPFDARGGVILSVADDMGDRLLTVAVPIDAVIAYCRASLPRAKAPGVVDTRAEAIKPVPVVLEATLGQVEISLSELPGLAPGDVLVLDLALGALVDVAIRNSGTPMSRGTLIEVEGQMALTLQPLVA